MHDLQIAWRPLGELIPYARNPRTHTDAQVAQIAASIREFGWTVPILVDGANGIIAGHGRVLAARKLGLERVPVIELAHMSEAQKRAYVLADNMGPGAAAARTGGSVGAGVRARADRLRRGRARAAAVGRRQDGPDRGR
jgi:ParB-like nuclease domain